MTLGLEDRCSDPLSYGGLLEAGVGIEPIAAVLQTAGTPRSLCSPAFLYILLDGFHTFLPSG